MMPFVTKWSNVHQFNSILKDYLMDTSNGVKVGTLVLVAVAIFVLGRANSEKTVSTLEASTIKQTVITGTKVTLSQEKNSKKNKKNYPKDKLWKIVDKPKDSKAKFSSNSFLPDVDGAYVIQRIDAEGKILFPEDYIHLNSKTKNTPPTANAGKDQIGFIEDTIQLDGSESSDPDWNLLKFEWTVSSKPENSKIILKNLNNAQPTFSADIEGKYIFCLKVSDNEASSHDEVTITLSDKKDKENSAPIADAGKDMTVKVGTVVKLDGSKSYDIDGGIEGFDWFISSKPDESNALIEDDNLVLATIKMDIEGEFIVSLKVRDATSDSEISRVKITVTSDRVPPEAVAGDDLNIKLNKAVTLDGSLSTADTEEIAFYWYFVSKPEGSQAIIESNDTAEPIFSADKKGSYTIGLEVTDQHKESDTDSLVILVDSEDNSEPTAKIVGLDKIVKSRKNITLDGSQSSDIDGGELNYRWFFINNPSPEKTKIMNSTSPKAILTGVIEAYYAVGLEVSDGEKQNTAEGWVMVYPNIQITKKPDADAGYNQKAFITSQVNLKGSGNSSIKDGKITYKWSFKKKPYGSRAELTNTQDTSFKADLLGDYLVSLETIVGDTKSNKDNVKVTVVPLEISLKWNPPKKKKNKKAITGYKVYFRHGSEKKEMMIGPVSSFIIPKLELNQTYYVMLAACVEDGLCTKPTGELRFDTTNKEIK